MSTTPTEAAPSSESSTDLSALKPRFLHTAFHVADIDRALAFYVGALGLKEQLRLPLGGGLQEVILAFPNAPQGPGVILMWKTGDASPRELGNGYSRLVLNVSDVDTAVQQLTARGTPVVTPVTTVGTFKYAMVKDPDGYIIELLQFIRG